MSRLIHCRSYTHARRHPQVIGRIGGFVLPTPLTPSQAGVLLASGGALLASRQWWAHLPGAGNLAVAIGLPLLLTWTVRHARVEGRSPARFALGLLTYMVRPRRGLHAGRRR